MKQSPLKIASAILTLFAAHTTSYAVTTTNEDPLNIGGTTRNVNFDLGTPTFGSGDLITDTIFVDSGTINAGSPFTLNMIDEGNGNSITPGSTAGFIVSANFGLITPDLASLVTFTAPPGFDFELVNPDPFNQGNNPYFIRVLAVGSNPCPLCPNAKALCIYLNMLPSKSTELSDLESKLDGLSNPLKDQGFLSFEPSRLADLATATFLNVADINNLISSHICQIRKSNVGGGPESVWAIPYTSFDNFSGEDCRFGFSTDSGGFLIGYDSVRTQNSMLGFILAVSGSKLKWEKNMGSGSLLGGTLGALMSWNLEHIFLEAMLTGSFFTYDASRHVFFDTIDRNAESDFNALEADLRLGGGYNFGFKSFGAELFGNGELAVLNTGAFAETGAGAANHVIPSRTSFFGRAEAGMSFYKKFGNWCPKCSISWVYKAFMGGGTIESRLSETTSSYTVETRNRHLNQVAIVPELVYESPDGATFSIFYSGEFGTHVEQHAIGIKGGKRF